MEKAFRCHGCRHVYQGEVPPSSCDCNEGDGYDPVFIVSEADFAPLTQDLRDAHKMLTPEFLDHIVARGFVMDAFNKLEAFK